MLTNKQLKAIVTALESRAMEELVAAKDIADNVFKKDLWIIHMTTSTVCSTIAEAIDGVLELSDEELEQIEKEVSAELLSMRKDIQ